MFCLKCGKECADNVKFCPVCGYEFPKEIVAQSKEVSAVLPQEQVVPIEKETVIVEEKPKKVDNKKKKAIVISIIAVVLVIAIVLGVIFGVGLFDKKDENDSGEETTTTTVETLADKIDELAETEPYYVKTVKEYNEDGTLSEIGELTYNKNNIVLKEKYTFYSSDGEYRIDEYEYNLEKNEIYNKYSTFNKDGQLLKTYETKDLYFADGFVSSHWGEEFFYIRYYESVIYTEHYSNEYDNYLFEIIFDEKGRITECKENGVSLVNSKNETEEEYKISIIYYEGYLELEYLYENNKLKSITNLSYDISDEDYDYIIYAEYYETGVMKLAKVADDTTIISGNFDGQGNVVRVEENHYDLDLSKEEIQEKLNDHNEFKNLDRLIYKDDVVVEYEYDANNNIVSKTEVETKYEKKFAGEESFEQTTLYTTKTNYEYDEKGNLISIAETTQYNCEAYYNGERYEELCEEDEPESKTIYKASYEYNGDAIASVHREEYADNDNFNFYDEKFDEYGNITKQVRQNCSVVFDESGNYAVSSVDFTETITYENRYDSNGRLISVTEKQDGALVAETTYEYAV